MHLKIDGHLDLALNAISFGRDLTAPLSEINRHESGLADHPCRSHATVSLPDLRAAGVAVCLGTVLARIRPGVRSPGGEKRIDIDFPFPAAAYASAFAQYAYYELMESVEQVKLIRTVDDLEHHWRRWEEGREQSKRLPVGIILSMEGADPIMSPDQSHKWWDMGFRVVSLAHYGAGVYASGTGSDGPLTDAGRELLIKFGRLGMVLDITHLCDRSFFEAMDLFTGPVLASHHNCRSLVNADRQLTDEQIVLLANRGAVIGVALDAWMLYTGWVRGSTSPDVLNMSSVADHVDHICQVTGSVKHVGIGSDLDGGFGFEQTPKDCKSIEDLEKLSTILSKRGYKAEDIDAVFHRNLLDFFKKNLPS